MQIAKGLIRKLDKLGRIVIPKEIRDEFEIDIGNQVEIYVSNSSIILKKYHQQCIFCTNTKKVIKFKDKLICKECIKNIKNEVNS